MCTYSAIMDYGREKIPTDYWDAETWKQFQEILKQLKALDDKLDQPDCESEHKTEWMKEIEERLRALETSNTPAE